MAYRCGYLLVVRLCPLLAGLCARGPRQVTVDYMAMHHLDSHSSDAFTAFGVRVSAPQKQQITLKTPVNALLNTRSQLEDRWQYGDGYSGGFPTVQLGRQFIHGSDRVRYSSLGSPA